MIGLLALCLFSMPLKKLNEEWDQQDPNQAIPEHDRQLAKDVEAAIDEIAPAHEIEENGSRKDQPEVVQIEQAGEDKKHEL
jgi:hypothetical protein